MRRIFAMLLVQFLLLSSCAVDAPDAEPARAEQALGAAGGQDCFENCLWHTRKRRTRTWATYAADADGWTCEDLWSGAGPHGLLRPWDPTYQWLEAHGGLCPVTNEPCGEGTPGGDLGYSLSCECDGYELQGCQELGGLLVVELRERYECSRCTPICTWVCPAAPPGGSN